MVSIRQDLPERLTVCVLGPQLSKESCLIEGVRNLSEKPAKIDNLVIKPFQVVDVRQENLAKFIQTLNGRSYFIKLQINLDDQIISDASSQVDFIRQTLGKKAIMVLVGITRGLRSDNSLAMNQKILHLLKQDNNLEYGVVVNPAKPDQIDHVFRVGFAAIKKTNAQKPNDPRSVIKRELKKYISDTEKLQGNFGYGFFCLFRKSQAINREVNYEYAKYLRQQLKENKDKTVVQIFADAKNTRKQQIPDHIKNDPKKLKYVKNSIFSPKLRKVLSGVREYIKRGIKV